MAFNIQKVGNKVAGEVAKGLSYGQKVTGNIAKYGKKVTSAATKGLDAVSKVPVVGVALAPEIGAARSAVGVVSNVSSMAGDASKIMGAAAGGVRSTQHAILKGDTQQALGIMRDTAKDTYGASQGLKSRARSALERKK